MTSYKVFIIKTYKKLTFGLGRAACGAIDTFTGGLGNDASMVANGGGHDTIADFTIGQDKVDLTGGRHPDPVQA
jgi:hypothetical protein